MGGVATPLPPAAGAVTPSGPGYDTVLLAHVGCALVGLLAVVASGVQAARLLGPARRGHAPGAGLTRYFAPGVNWAGRALYGVPVFGFGLVALSGGSISAGDAWVVAGLVLWVAATAVAEGLLWPAERRIQSHLAASGRAAAGAPGAAEPGLERAARTACAAAAAVSVLVLAAIVVMVVQP